MAEGKSSKPTIDRENTCPFLLRTFVKTGGFHNVELFEDGQLPVEEEHQLYTWKDATLREVVTLLRASSPSAFRHPLARFSFRLIFTDPARGGRTGSKDLGMIHARELINTNALTLEEDDAVDPVNGHADDRTLEELRLIPGDFLCVAVMVPYSARTALAAAPIQGFAMRGMSARGAPLGRGGLPSAGRGSGDAGWGGGLGAGRGARDEPAGGGHWRGRGGPPAMVPGGLGRSAVGRGGDRYPDDDRRPVGGRRGPGGDRDGGRGGDRDVGRGSERDADRDRNGGGGWGRRAPLPRRERDNDRDEDVDMDEDRDRTRDRERDRPRRRRTPSRSRSPLPRRDRDDRY